MPVGWRFPFYYLGIHSSHEEQGGQEHELMIRARGPDSKAPGRLQILHYNIERFPDDIKDLRGLETLLVARYVRESQFRRLRL